MERIGFFGGCFNPITIAHVALVKGLIKREKLDKVYFVPMGDLYQKQDLLPLKHRKKMLELVLEKEDKFDILDISNKESRTYAIDTFQTIDEKFPEAQRFFIMGTDNFEKMKTWKGKQELKKYEILVLDRNEIKISSTVVRQKIRRQEKFEDFVPKQIIEYIKENNLYRG